MKTATGRASNEFRGGVLKVTLIGPAELSKLAAEGYRLPAAARAPVAAWRCRHAVKRAAAKRSAAKRQRIQAETDKLKTAPAVRRGKKLPEVCEAAALDSKDCEAVQLETIEWDGIKAPWKLL